MRFAERKEFVYDGEVFKTSPDVMTAARIHSEYIKRFTMRPPPRFLEVDRRSEKVDHLWHVPLDDRTVFSRVIDMPAIIQFERPDWRLTRVGLVPQQKAKFWMGNLILQEFDWFPMRGDMAVWNGYRHMIINVVLEPAAFWGQSNFWLGLVCETIIPAEGDARPNLNQAVPVPRELLQTRAIPEV